MYSAGDHPRSPTRCCQVDGNVFVVDRLKELIKVNGHQLEALLATHPQVADAAVVRQPDDERGEVPVAVVVPHGELDREALMTWVAERVAPYKRIRAVRTAEAIPRTPAGKILRRCLGGLDGPRRSQGRRLDAGKGYVT